MRLATPLLALTCACGAASTPSPEMTETTSPTPPVARRGDHVHSEHGVERQDPYFWMRSDDRSDPEVLAYLAEENAYAEAVLATQAAATELIFEEIVGRIPKNESSVPWERDGYRYSHRYVEGGEYAVHVRTSLEEGAEETVILDENADAEGQPFYSASGLSVSDDANTLAWGEDLVGRRIYTIRFKDLRTGEPLPDRIEGTTGRGTWAADGRTYFYVKREEGTLRAHQVWRHELGQSDDTLVFDETDEEFSVGVGRSRSRELVLIGSHQTIADEYRAIDASTPDQEPRVLIPRRDGHEYSLDHANGRYYIRTNHEAVDFRIVSATAEEVADLASWRDEVPAREGFFVQSFELFSGHLVVSERREGLARLRVMPWGDGGAADVDAGHEIAFEEAAYVSGIGENAQFDTATLRFDYTSMTTPGSVFDYEMNARTRELRKRSEVVGGFDPEQYETTRLVARARDGAMVPISLVRRRDLGEGPKPLLLYGYGSYGYSMEPGFSIPRLSLLDRGVVFAIAHVRGGSEMGRAWYDDGKLMNKRHTFEDFIDCAEHLVQQGITSPDRLFAQGGSAGGLLMGAVVNMRPDLFDAVVSQVPFVDVVTTMLDASIPLTTFEYDEWGNPSERAAFDYMLSYSPYDNVGEVDHPAMLVLTGLHDSQVQYWEPAKWVARLRHRNTGDDPIIFVTNMDAGHGGASGRFRRQRETARTYAFLLSRVR